jgi:hypothetical protein
MRRMSMAARYRDAKDAETHHGRPRQLRTPPPPRAPRCLIYVKWRNATKPRQPQPALSATA